MFFIGKFFSSEILIFIIYLLLYLCSLISDELHYHQLSGSILHLDFFLIFSLSVILCILSYSLNLTFQISTLAVSQTNDSILLIFHFIWGANV